MDVSLCESHFISRVAAGGSEKVNKKNYRLKEQKEEESDTETLLLLSGPQCLHVDKTEHLKSKAHH